jgi:hypothetical protein
MYTERLQWQRLFEEDRKEYTAWKTKRKLSQLWDMVSQRREAQMTLQSDHEETGWD